MQPGFEDRLRLERALADGRVIAASELPVRAGKPLRYFPSLGLGRYELAVRAENGARLTGTFAIETLTPSDEAIRVAMR